MKYLFKKNNDNIITTIISNQGQYKDDNIKDFIEFIPVKGFDFNYHTDDFVYKYIDVLGKPTLRDSDDIASDTVIYKSNNRNSKTILNDILSSFTGAGLERILDAMDKYCTFKFAIDNRNFDLAKLRLKKAKDNGDLTAADVTKITGFLPTL